MTGGVTTPKRLGQATSLTDTAFGGLAWQFGSTVGKGVLQVVTLAILARLVTPEEFGIVGAALIVVGLSAIFSQFGVGPALVHLEPLRSAHIRAAFAITLVLSLSTTLAVWTSAPVIAGFFAMHDLSVVLRALSLSFLFAGLGVIPESLLQRELRFRALAVVDLASFALGYGALSVLLASMGYGVWALVGGHLGSTICRTCALLICRRHPAMPPWPLSAGSDLVRYGFGFTLTTLGNYAALQGDNVIVGRVLGAGPLGIYGRAYQLLVTPASIFGRVLDRVLFPTLASVQGDQAKLSVAYTRSIGLVATCTLPASVLVIVLANEGVRALLGPDWISVVLPLQILTLGLVCRTSYKISDSLVRATGAVYRSAWRQWAYAVLTVVGAIVGSRWGVPGVAAGTLTAIVVKFILMLRLSQSITGARTEHLIRAHIPGLRLSLATGIVAGSTAVLLRSLEAPPVVTMVAVGAAIGLVVRSWLLVRWPWYFLGEEGVWLLRTAHRNLPSSIARLVLPPCV